MTLNKKIIILFLIALSARVLFSTALREFQVAPDGIGYDAIARNIAAGSGFALEPGVPTPTRAPLYPFFLAGIYFVFGHSYFAVMLAQALLDSLTCVLLFRIALYMLKNEAAATLTAAIYALYPVAIACVNTLISETLFTFIFLLSVYALAAASNGKPRVYYVYSGAALGLATLTRGTTIAFPVMILLLFLLTKKKFLDWLIIVLAMAVILAPWTIRNYGTFHRFIPVGSVGPGLGLYTSGLQASGQGSYEECIEKGRKIAASFPEDYIESETFLKAEGLKLIKRNPGGYVLLVIKRFPRFWLSSNSSALGAHEPLQKYLAKKDYGSIALRVSLLFLQALVLLSAAAGMCSMVKTHGVALLPLFILVYFTGHITFDPVPRYAIPAMPCLFIFSSAGILAAIEYFKGGDKWKA